MHESWFCVSLVVLFSPPALASTIYPHVLQSELKLAQTPECVVCHTTSRGGPNTARKPFAQTLVALGLTGSANVEQLKAVVQELGDADSDGDGVRDVLELQSSSDPNDAHSVPEQPTEPQEVHDTSAGPRSVDAGDVSYADARVDGPHFGDGGSSEEGGVPSPPATSARDDNRVPADEAAEDGSSSRGCEVCAGAASAPYASVVGVALLTLARRRRAGGGKRRQNKAQKDNSDCDEYDQSRQVASTLR